MTNIRPIEPTYRFISVISLAALPDAERQPEVAVLWK
jgi:hypothetical protein